VLCKFLLFCPLLLPITSYLQFYWLYISSSVPIVTMASVVISDMYFVMFQNLAAEKTYNNLDITISQALAHRCKVSIRAIQYSDSSVLFMCLLAPTRRSTGAMVLGSVRHIRLSQYYYSVHKYLIDFLL
jgi:hypothetical protein